ncbi:sister chromatid cohesion protein DCC1-like [Pollicipes pollicipes]|uniref:sister chromatid cohesion protein DCC1-like n=1 Tax=Pollicipes pollicipes TaxID=41117 RepID=UPI001884BECC|nr:sister chromatid cohesion protein DCC1-like [Pollicipes pollicipes]
MQDCLGSRSIQNVDIIAEKAKLQVAELLPKAQTLYFAKGCLSNASQMTLVEADNHILEHVVQGGSLVIRGEPSDAAVICTGQRTYEVREAETSNALLLLDTLSWPEEVAADQPRHVTDRQVQGTFGTYLELRECRHTVQASDAELEAALRQCHALLMDGQYRQLECEYEFHVFSLVMKFIDENSWSADAVRRPPTLETLSELEPEAVVTACFDRYLRPVTEPAEQYCCRPGEHCTSVVKHGAACRRLPGEQLFTLHEDEVARLFARLLLHTMKTFNLADFTASWRQSVPEGVTTDLEQLRGLAVVNREVSPELVVRLQATDLPEEAAGRFQALFAIKQLWTGDELLPYVEDLTSPTLKLGSLLAKHCRMTARRGVKMYGPKHGH